MKKRQNGLTLVETLIVIAIVAVLGATIGLVIMGPAKSTAVRIDCSATLKQTALAINLYIDNNDSKHQLSLDSLDDEVVTRCPQYRFKYIYATGYAFNQNGHRVPRWESEFEPSLNSIVKCPTHNNWKGETEMLTTKVDGATVSFPVPSLSDINKLRLLGARLDGSVSYFDVREEWENNAPQTQHPKTINEEE